MDCYKGLPLTFKAESTTPDKQQGTWPPNTALWTWNKDDKSPPYTPQGITSFVDPETAQHLIVVSWHAGDPGAASGSGDARISYLQKNDDGSYQYGHARLGNPGETSKLHAGGIAYFGGKLLVASTGTGVVAFDVTHPHKGTDGAWQVDKGETYELKAEISDAALKRFSFADVDWSNPDQPVLLTGVYVDAGSAGTYDPSVLGWALKDDGPVLAPPTVFLDDTTSSGDFRYMQGVAHFGDTWYLSQSGSVHALRSVNGELSDLSPKVPPIVDTKMGLEDLHIPSDGKSLWGLTENADLDVQNYPRVFFQIPLPLKPA